MESNKEILERKDIKKEHQWDLESMFINFNEWRNLIIKLRKWLEILSYIKVE